jgi:hypothetical protein
LRIFSDDTDRFSNQRGNQKCSAWVASCAAVNNTINPIMVGTLGTSPIIGARVTSPVNNNTGPNERLPIDDKTSPKDTSLVSAATYSMTSSMASRLSGCAPFAPELAPSLSRLPLSVIEPSFISIAVLMAGSMSGRTNS